jgi:hypothetical protein
VTESELPHVLTAFFIVVDKHGSVNVYSDTMPSVNVARSATLQDIETFGSQAAKVAGRLIAAKDVQHLLVRPPETPTADRIADALTKRAGE